MPDWKFFAKGAVMLNWLHWVAKWVAA